jgi:hypothetical protein
LGILQSTLDAYAPHGYTTIVYTRLVLKNITLSADAELIERARGRATEQKTSLNTLFRQWLQRYADSGSLDQDYRRLMKTLRDVDAGRKFTRQEMNSR